MRKLARDEVSILIAVLERVLGSMEEYDKGHYSSNEDLLIAMDEEALAKCKSALAKLEGSL